VHAWEIRPGDEIAIFALQDPEKLRCRRVLVLSAEYKGQSPIGPGLAKTYFQVEIQASKEDKRALEATARMNGRVEPYLAFAWRTVGLIPFPFTFDASIPWLKYAAPGSFAKVRLATPEKDHREESLQVLTIDKSAPKSGVHVVFFTQLEQLNRLLNGFDSNGNGKIDIVTE
jgi:hypothetical protein